MRSLHRDVKRQTQSDDDVAGLFGAGNGRKAPIHIPPPVSGHATRDTDYDCGNDFDFDSDFDSDTDSDTDSDV